MNRVIDRLLVGIIQPGDAELWHIRTAFEFYEEVLSIMGYDGMDGWVSYGHGDTEFFKVEVTRPPVGIQFYRNESMPPGRPFYGVTICVLRGSTCAIGNGYTPREALQNCMADWRRFVGAGDRAMQYSSSRDEPVPLTRQNLMR